MVITIPDIRVVKTTVIDYNLIEELAEPQNGVSSIGKFLPIKKLNMEWPVTKCRANNRTISNKIYQSITGVELPDSWNERE
jgi:hypothetical protein